MTAAAELVRSAGEVPAVVSSPAIARVTVGPYGQTLDQLEVTMMQLPAAECPVVHRFTPGLYIREITMPAGSLITSKIHKTEHPFTVSKGRVSVLTDLNEWQEIEAPYTGITKPGTRRVLYVHEDTVWTTYHPLGEMQVGDLGGLTDQEKVDRIEGDIIEKHDEHRAGLIQPPAPALIEQGG
jgi:hypothetical protein